MARTTLKPGGIEIHVDDLEEPIHDGDELPLTLTFARAEPVDIAAKVTRRDLGP
jgi:copper(I)-binding protein